MRSTQTNFASHMILMCSSEYMCKPLAKALLEIPAAKKAPSRTSVTARSPNHEHKILTSLDRIISDKRKAKLNSKCAIHVMECLDVTAHQRVSRADHIVVILCATDIISMTASSATSRHCPVVWDHPLVQHTMKNLHCRKDALLLQRFSIVLLLRQDEEDQAILTILTVSKRKSSIPIFICRPDQTSSCQRVAQVLWKRLHIAQRNAGACPLLLS